MKKQATLLDKYSNEFLISFYIQLLKIKLCSLHLIGLENEEYENQVAKLRKSFKIYMDGGICFAIDGERLEKVLLRYLFKCCSSFSGSIVFPVKSTKDTDFLSAEPHEMWGTGEYAANRRVILDECIETLEKHLKKRGVEV